MHATADHLLAFSSLLAQDPDAQRLHHRHLQVLALVCANTLPLSVRGIAEQIKLSPSATSRAVDKLVERGLLTRADSADDRRVAVVLPTEAGARLDLRVRGHFARAAQPAGGRRPASAA